MERRPACGRAGVRLREGNVIVMGGKPSKGTRKDKRLKANKRKAKR